MAKQTSKSTRRARHAGSNKPANRDAGTDSQETERQSVEGNLNSLGSEFAVAQEWGLFPQKNGTENKAAAEILASLKSAGAAIKSKDWDTASTELLKGRTALNSVQSKKWYIANNRYGVIPIILTLVGTVIIYFVLFVRLLNLSFLQTVHHPVFWGLVGAVLKSLYWLQQKTNRGQLRPRWFTYFIVAPFVGVILGALSTLLIRVVVRLANKSATAMPDWETVAVVAAFAAFNWEWALDKFKLGADAIYSKFVDKKKSASS
jgi:hypothetical protein